MGLEILEEFRPITPIQTVPPSRTLKRVIELSDLETTKEILKINEVEDINEECHTPTSQAQTIPLLLVCPPAPKKPRVTRRIRRSNNLAASPTSSHGFSQVPLDDLASVFVLRTPNPNLPNKKIKTSSN